GSSSRNPTTEVPCIAIAASATTLPCPPAPRTAILTKAPYPPIMLMIGLAAIWPASARIKTTVSEHQPEQLPIDKSPRYRPFITLQELVCSEQQAAPGQSTGKASIPEADVVRS